MFSILNWAIFLCFAWLLVRSIQQQSMSAQPTRDLIDEDLERLGRIAGRGFSVARGVADMTAALLLFVWKALTADETQKYASRAASSTVAFARSLSARARRMRAVPRHSDASTETISVEAETVEKHIAAEPDEVVIVPVAVFREERKSASSDVVGMGEELTSPVGQSIREAEQLGALSLQEGSEETAIAEPPARLLVASVPDFYADEPALEASWAVSGTVEAVECSEAIDPDPDEEALAFVADLRAARSAPLNAMSNLGGIRLKPETNVAEQSEPAQSGNLGFGLTRTPAQKPSRKNKQQRKGGASETGASKNGGPSVPQSVRKLPANDGFSRRLPIRGQQRGSR